MIETNCPNCGTTHYDFANLWDALHTFKAVVNGVSITKVGDISLIRIKLSNPTNSFYDDYRVSTYPGWNFDISMALVQDVSGVLAVSYKENTDETD